jgi:hypothetical protein
VLVWGGIAVAGYYLYKSLSGSVSRAAAGMQLPIAAAQLPSNIPPGLQAQIAAGSYPGQDLRMGIGTPGLNYRV